MRFLLNANMPCSTLAVFVERGHIQRSAFGTPAWAMHPTKRLRPRRVLIPLYSWRVIWISPMCAAILRKVADDWTAGRITTLVGQFLTMEGLIARIPCHLVILDRNHVRFRPALGW